MCNETRAVDNYQIQSAISPGCSSTVPGTRPKAMIYKFCDLDHNKLARFVSQHLKTLPTSGIKVAVLCDREISARQLSSVLRSNNSQVTCYDGGVERFIYGEGTPEYREDRADDRGEAELSEWLEARHGILVTHEPQFRGCEADAVIFVTRHWDGYNGSGSSRHPVTRAVAHLCIITGDTNLKIWGMRNYWDVEILEEGIKTEKPPTPPWFRSRSRRSGSKGSDLLQDCEQNKQI